MTLEDERRPCATMAEWVDSHDHPVFVQESAEYVAERFAGAALFRAHAAATIKLCCPLRNHERERWDEALAAVCDELGKRLDAANNAAHCHSENEGMQ